MKAVQVTLLVQDMELEERISDLEERCGKLDVSLQAVFQAAVLTMPYKPFIDVLLGLSDLKISDMEESERMNRLFDFLKIHRKKKSEKDG
ncbi:MAG: hypothetical protein HFI43_05795 [Lachnospiraceae bacterium]|jgi:hypothetical protein|nr:hypothetical protein [Lachnospiraceae bacterium]